MHPSLQTKRQRQPLSGGKLSPRADGCVTPETASRRLAPWRSCDPSIPVRPSFGRASSRARGLAAAVMSGAAVDAPDVRVWSLASGLGRVAFGVGMLAAPEPSLRALGFTEVGPATVTVTRIAGIRDLVLGPSRWRGSRTAAACARPRSRTRSLTRATRWRSVWPWARRSARPDRAASRPPCPRPSPGLGPRGA